MIDADRRVLGIVDPPAVLRWRRAGRHRSTALRDLLPPGRLVVAHPDEYLDAVIERMTNANVAHIPVVSRTDGRLVGYLGWKDLMRVRVRARAEERERVAFYRLRRPRRFVAGAAERL